MITKFKKNGSFNIRFRKGRRKPVSVEGTQKLGLQVKKYKVSNIHASPGICRVADAVDVPRSIVQNIMWSILQFYADKLELAQKLFLNDSMTQNWFYCSFMLAFRLIQNGLELPSGQMKHVFILMVP